jgi:hypothetical protein
MGQRVRQLRQRSLCHLDTLFGPLLPNFLLSQADDGPNSRDRVYSLRRTFFGFLYQVLNPLCSCRQIVQQIQALLLLDCSQLEIKGTSGYCQARDRLPLDVLSRLRAAAAAQADKAAHLWMGWCVKIIDGTGISLPDTLKNQRAYPQSAEQKPGCGFPWLKLVAIFNLSTGALLEYARGNKHQHELKLLYSLLDHFQKGDLVLADRGFSCYTLLALLCQRGVHCLFRLHHARSGDLRRGKRLGKHDRLMVWKKPQNWQRRYIPKAIWKLIAPELSVRVLRFAIKQRGFRSKSVTLVTTLLDPQRYPAEELARLYARRWQVELCFRNIKTTMGMEVLRCKSPKMIHKELEMFFIAYNLIRCLMTQASQQHSVVMERLSFKGSVDCVRQFSIAIVQARSKKKQSNLIERLLEYIARDEVPGRPGRREPRAVKRRPKPYPNLNKPRHQFDDLPHRNRYWKNNRRKKAH